MPSSLSRAAFSWPQLEAALAVARPAAVKLGVVPDARTLRVLFSAAARLRVPWVVDPVVRTSRGERLSRLQPRDFRGLARPWVWLTPNIPELAWLLGRRTLPGHVEAVTEYATALLADGFGAVVVKGGHAVGPATDVLVRREAGGALRRDEASPEGQPSRHGLPLCLDVGHPAGARPGGGERGARRPTGGAPLPRRLGRDALPSGVAGAALEAGEFREEDEVNGAGGAVALLGNDEFHGTAPREP